ncbi:hypothetical protein AUF12_05270 [Enterococcus avium]|jgi:hypothetical protein|uniref:hypothetical protein n=1 Tax=Enterococcus avium TaxID=33945 RepID=UPI000C9AC0B2|nr:hypothetical protein [Enterococcus avium]PNE49947.1 hypothetical protein AUF12_05270 [Enterococcus avium]DAM18172.1 MAG TPA: hypothetical protein [Caudoviricetes sp.]
MYALQLILENGIELKVFGELENLKPLKNKVEKNYSSKKFIVLTDSLTVKPINVCAIELFDVSEGEQNSED